MNNFRLQCIIFCEILDNKKEIQSLIFNWLYNSESYIYGEKLSENGWVVQKLFANKFSKCRSTKISLFFPWKKIHPKVSILSICSPHNALYFEYFRFSPTRRQMKKIEKSNERESWNFVRMWNTQKLLVDV